MVQLTGAKAIVCKGVVGHADRRGGTMARLVKPMVDLVRSGQGRRLSMEAAGVDSAVAAHVSGGVQARHAVMVGSMAVGACLKNLTPDVGAAAEMVGVAWRDGHVRVSQTRKQFDRSLGFSAATPARLWRNGGRRSMGQGAS